MGKGGDNPNDQSACLSMNANIQEDSSSSLLADSKRVQFTYQLVRQITGLNAEELLLNPNTGETVKDPKEQNKVMVHNLMLRIAPQAFRDPEKLRNALDLYYTILLDGDRRANHLWHYYDERVKGWWTPGAAQSARQWYGLPADDQGLLKPEELAQAVQRALGSDNWLERMQQAPSQTLAQSSSQTPDEKEIRMEFLEQLAMGMSQEEQTSLRKAVELLPSWGQPIDIPQDCEAEVASVLEDLSVGLSEEGLPVVQAHGTKAALVADAWQSWMASPYCDVVSEQLRIDQRQPDDPQWLSHMGSLCARTPWHSTQGRKILRPLAKAQESRLRKIAIDLLSKPSRPSKAPKRQPDLVAQI